jgi:two-component system sensor histidine kinase PilS (NtrC family)
VYLRSRLQRLIAVRVLVSTALLGWAILIQISRPGSFPIDPFFFLIGVTYALGVVYLATLRLAERYSWLVDLQFGIDAVLISAFIFLTGGITSYFSSLYALPIVAASRIRFRRGALQVAALNSILYLSLVSGQYLDVFPTSWAPGFSLAANSASMVALPTLWMAQFTVATNLFGFLAVALLSGSLADSLRTTGARLERVSHQIKDLRAFNEFVIDSLLSGLITADSECRVLTFNRAAGAITSLPASKVIGADAGRVLQLPDDARARLQALRDGSSLRVDVEYRTGDNRTIDVGLTATTLAFPAGRTGYLFTFQDVTKVKRLEREAQHRQRLAAVGEMAAGIAHEIRNPLASMSGSIQVLRQELPLTEDQAQLMDIVLRESERLNDTIRSFLAYAKPQRSSPSRLDVGKIVQDAALLLRNSGERHADHVVDVNVPAEPVWCDADENHLRQIIWNLATNGLRAMEGGGRLRISVAAEDGDSPDVVLSVEDEGCGIPADQRDHLFQPFHSSFRNGTGLGLAIVHRTVTDYGGVIEVSSTVGVGTTMQVRLPVAVLEAQAV